ncbi:hypothetical protein H2204_011537 [Knufia peltigerae]|uniref:Xylanolytic transcriptional activator regulatory domain-containing protein n=1 Tax=Knufia peltigerae TaxID=1002370 RepID=A0AA39CTV4_9EURO|nr:hypothetical protein H2204_011537 [Knufia peltigerae]
MPLEKNKVPGWCAMQKLFTFQFAMYISTSAQVSQFSCLGESQSAISSAINGILPPATSKSGNYRRSEKDFSSNRSSNSNQASRQTYCASPSCRTFIEQFVNWAAVQRAQLTTFADDSFDPEWASLGHSEFGPMHPGLEISIETEVSRSSALTESKRPIKIRLPPYNHSIYLIQCAEAAIGHDQHYFRRRHLRARVRQMYEDPESSRSKDHGWLCYWLAALALGELYKGNGGASGANNSLDVDPILLDTAKEPPGSEYYHQSIAFLQQVAENPDIQYIETLCLLTMYAFSMDKINTAYMYNGIGLRAALSLGLHRSPLDFPSDRSDLTVAELEYQRRVFWTVYYQDLLTTTTTGRPWGILDDEITIEYADSSRLAGDSLLDFFDSDESNAHLELMRLRGQAYSSLYGYAGTAINPYSHISLFNFDLGNSLSQQHLDKIDEFHQGLIAWQQELLPKMKLLRSWDGSLMNLNRVNASLHLIYHQTILVLLRPALVNIHNDRFDARSKGFTSVIDLFPGSKTMLQAFYSATLESARETARILEWLQYQSILSIHSYFDASYAFTAAIVLYLTKQLRTFTYPGLDPLLFTDDDQYALDTVLRILQLQSSAGNIPARDFEKRLRLLESNLSALEAALANHVCLDELNFDIDHLDARMPSLTGPTETPYAGP